MVGRLCPKCSSPDIEQYEGLAFIRCRSCGYDELGTEKFPYDVRKSQREKGKFTLYKQGGHGRGKK